MAKKKKGSSFREAPWPMKGDDLKKYIKVTESNRKNAVVLGRVMFVIKTIAGKHEYNGFFDIRPRILKGNLRVVGHPIWRDVKDITMYMWEEESMEDYAKSFKELIDCCIREEKLYINTELQLIQYHRE